MDSLDSHCVAASSICTLASALSYLSRSWSVLKPALERLPTNDNLHIPHQANRDRKQTVLLQEHFIVRCWVHSRFRLSNYPNPKSGMSLKFLKPISMRVKTDLLLRRSSTLPFFSMPPAGSTAHPEGPCECSDHLTRHAEDPRQCQLRANLSSINAEDPWMKVIRFCMSLPRNLQSIPSKAKLHTLRSEEPPCNMLLDGDANLATFRTAGKAPSLRFPSTLQVCNSRADPICCFRQLAVPACLLGAGDLRCRAQAMTQRSLKPTQGRGVVDENRLNVQPNNSCVSKRPVRCPSHHDQVENADRDDHYHEYVAFDAGTKSLHTNSISLMELQDDLTKSLIRKAPPPCMSPTHLFCHLHSAIAQQTNIASVLVKLHRIMHHKLESWRRAVHRRHA